MNCLRVRFNRIFFIRPPSDANESCRLLMYGFTKQVVEHEVDPSLSQSIFDIF